VADATALGAWFSGDDAMRREYEAGAVVIVGPTHLPSDLVAELARRFDVDADRLGRLAREVGQLGLELRDPPLAETAQWIGRGLDPRRAAYAALAGALDLPLVTSDRELRRVAATVIGSD
jgi:hypothetical protein